MNISGPEIDEDDEKSTVDNNIPSHGIDDGFFNGNGFENPDGPKTGRGSPFPNGSRRGSLPPFPYGPTGNPDLVSLKTY